MSNTVAGYRLYHTNGGLIKADLSPRVGEKLITQCDGNWTKTTDGKRAFKIGVSGSFDLLMCRIYVHEGDLLVEC